MSRVHQLIPVFSPGDAMGGVVLQLQRMLRELGHESTIFGGEVDDRLRDAARPAAALDAEELGPDDGLIYHLSIGSPVARRWERSAARPLLFYANITPPEFWRAVNPRVAFWAEQGRRDLRRLAPRAAVTMTHSTFSLEEARAAGAGAGLVVPVCDAGRLIPRGAAPTDPPTVLFVGRAAPNKRHEDLVRALAALRATEVPDARLVLAGSGHDGDAYLGALRRLVAELDLGDAVELPGSRRRSDEELATLYATASVYASASVHEGFCVPMLEAMAFSLPIVARAEAAVPETVGDAGLLLDTADPLVWAAALARVIGDVHLRQTLVERGQRRLEDFSEDRVRARLREALSAAGMPA